MGAKINKWRDKIMTLKPNYAEKYDNSLCNTHTHTRTQRHIKCDLTSAGIFSGQCG